jgi:hypothetical protein
MAAPGLRLTQVVRVLIADRGAGVPFLGTSAQPPRQVLTVVEGEALAQEPPRQQMAPQPRRVRGGRPVGHHETRPGLAVGSGVLPLGIGVPDLRQSE